MRAWSTGAGDMRRARAACEKLVALLGDECPTVSGHTSLERARVGWLAVAYRGGSHGGKRTCVGACVLDQHWVYCAATQLLRHGC